MQTSVVGLAGRAHRVLIPIRHQPTYTVRMITDVDNQCFPRVSTMDAQLKRETLTTQKLNAVSFKCVVLRSQAGGL